MFLGSLTVGLIRPADETILISDGLIMSFGHPYMAVPYFEQYLVELVLHKTKLLAFLLHQNLSLPIPDLSPSSLSSDPLPILPFLPLVLIICFKNYYFRIRR